MNFTYVHPMASEKHETAMSIMIDYLEKQIEMLDQLTLGKSDPLKLALEMAQEIKEKVETPMIKGVYEEGRWDQYHGDDPEFKGLDDVEGAERYNAFIRQESEDFYSECFLPDDDSDNDDND